LYFILHYLVKNARAQVKELHAREWPTQLPTEGQESLRLLSKPQDHDCVHTERHFSLSWTGCFCHISVPSF